MVSHYDFSKQHNLRQFSLTQVQPWAQAPSAFESTRAIAKYLSALNASKHGPLKLMPNAKTLSAQPDHRYHRLDRTDYHPNTMEHPRILEPTECKHAIRHLNGTHNPELNAFTLNASYSFTFFDDFQKQRLLETKDIFFELPNSTHFTCCFCLDSNFSTVLSAILEEKAVRWYRYEFNIEKTVGFELFKKLNLLRMMKIIN